MPEQYYLTEADRDAVAELLRFYRNYKRNRPIFDFTDNSGTYAETYIGKTNEIIAGITESAGTSGDPALPSYGNCTVYAIQNTTGTDSLFSSGKTIIGYNISSITIPAETWIVLTKTKYGQWLIIKSGVSEIEDEVVGTGTGTDSIEGDNDAGSISYCNLASLHNTNCILVVSMSTGDTEIIEGPGGVGTSTGDIWTSSTPINYYGTASGTVRFWFAEGSLHLSIAGMELINCGNGCFKGGPLTGHINQDPTVTTCVDDSFEICVRCISCPAPEEPVIEGCCTPRPADTLYATFSNITGTCVCLPASTVLSYLGTAEATDCWEGPNFTCPITECEENAVPRLCCVAGQYSWNGLAPVSSTCNPFQVVFNKTIQGGSYTVTITE